MRASAGDEQRRLEDERPGGAAHAEAARPDAEVRAKARQLKQGQPESGEKKRPSVGRSSYDDIQTVAILDLRPTQITIGVREVHAKRKHWQDRGERFLDKYLFPVILGPNGRRYLIDHHHLALALHQEGVKDVAVTGIANLSRLDRDYFWFFMEHRNWAYPVDADGRRRPYSDLPKSVVELIDDPFHSLAGELRRAGGFANTTPFNELLWVDFLRRRIKRKVVDNDFYDAVMKALQLARSVDANHLPGWCGPVPEE
jgi:hypothetical protein